MTSLTPPAFPTRYRMKPVLHRLVSFFPCRSGGRGRYRYRSAGASFPVQFHEDFQVQLQLSHVARPEDPHRQAVEHAQADLHGTVVFLPRPARWSTICNLSKNRRTSPAPPKRVRFLPVDSFFGLQPWPFCVILSFTFLVPPFRIFK